MPALSLTESIRALAARAGEGRPFVVALDGRSGVGKSTLARDLAERLGAAIVEGDDFFAGGVSVREDGPRERAETCIDWRRQRPVLAALRAGRRASWRRFDWSAFDGSLAPEAVVCEPAPVVVLEGVYSGRPELADLLDHRVLVTAPDEVRMQRLLAREGSIGPWERQWHEAEVHYFTHIAPAASFDRVFKRASNVGHGRHGRRRLGGRRGGAANATLPQGRTLAIQTRMRGPPLPSEAPALAAGEGRAAGAEPAVAEPSGPVSSSPSSLGAIFLVFLLVGATSFGGGASAHVHDAVVVRKQWLDEERFLEALTVGRSLPGTNVSNLAAFVGAMLAGTRGALVAFVGVVAPGVVAVLLVASAYVSLAGASASPVFKGAFQGLAAGAVGVMASTVAQTAKTAVRARGGLVIAAGAFVAVALFRVNLLLVLVALVPLGSALYRARGR